MEPYGRSHGGKPRRGWRSRARPRALAAEAGMRAVLEASFDPIVSIDHEGRVIELNRAAETAFGCSRGEAVGRDMGELVVPSALRERHREGFWKAGAKMLGRQLELTGKHRDGGEFPVEMTLVRIEGSDPPFYTGVLRDTTERDHTRHRLGHLALHDGLTGAVGRTLFMERLARALTGRRREGRLVAVLLVDIDRFRSVNDTVGHQAGDRVLVEIARRIGSVIRPEDTLARLSGDEFTVLCEDVGDESDALAVAARLKATVEAPLRIEGRRMRPGVSVGVAIARGGRDKPASVLNDADAAMDRAKQHAHDAPVLFAEDLGTAATERLGQEGELAAAIEDGELVLHYQPQVDLSSGMLVGVEALVRWDHPVRGLLPPEEFIPLAEETGLIVPLGEQVLARACVQAREWAGIRPGTAPLTMSVNVSPVQLLSPTLLGAVERTLESSGLDPGFLCLEITERTLVEDGPTTAAAIASLSALGVGLAIDDFGTGYSSLSYLRLLPVDSLKVDAIFVEGLGRRRDDRAIVGAVIQMAHALGMGVVAEGVESEQQVTELRDLGCDLGQGFRFARPAPAEAVQEVIERPRPLAGVQPAGG